MEELNRDDDEILKGGTGGMDKGAVNDTMDKDISNPNFIDDADENIKEKYVVFKNKQDDVRS